MTPTSERLYRLLPAIYRIRDHKLGSQKQDSPKDGPLEKFLLAIAEGMGGDNWRLLLTGRAN